MKYYGGRQTYSNLFSDCYPTDFFYADFNIAWRLRHALVTTRIALRLRESLTVRLAFISAADPEVITTIATLQRLLWPRR
jgi:hypothetical protein